MEKSGVLRSAGVVGGFTLLSRVLGLTRDILMAAFFGTSAAMSWFVVAFMIPNLFRRLFGEGALSAAFVPVFVEVREQGGEEQAWSLARKIASLLTLTLAVITLAGILLMTLAMLGLAGPKVGMILSLARIMLPYMIFICLAALAMAILNSYHHFAIPAATPCLLNIIWIGSILFVSPWFGETMEERIYGVAWGILAAGFVQLLFQLPKLRAHGYRPGWALDLRDRSVRRVLALMGPAAVGLAVTQVNVLIDRALAAGVGDYAPAALFYSERLIYLPLGLFGTALGTVLLPVFSRQSALNQDEQIRETMNHSLRNLLFLMIPAAVGLLVLAGPIVQMIFEVRAFGARSTWYTATALKFYAPGLVVFSLAKVFVPVFYAHKDTKTPVLIGVGTVCLKLALSLLFIFTWPQDYKHAGLAFSTVLAESVYAGTLILILQRRYGSPGWRRIGNSLLRFAVAAAGMGWVARLGYRALSDGSGAWLASVKMAQVVSVLGAIGGAMVAYFILAGLLRCPEIGELRRSFSRRKGSSR